MIIAPSKQRLLELVTHQVTNLFFLDEPERAVIEGCLDSVLRRVEECFQASTNKYYRRDGSVFFSIYHSAQYTTFLYVLSRKVFQSAPEFRDLADKLYYLNKTLNGLDLYYEVELPTVFHLDHPVGTVLGRAVYGGGFTFSQLCTVGNNKGHYPVIGENVTMMSGSKVVGNCIVGDNVTLSANAYVKDENIPADCLVFGASPNIVLKHKTSRQS